MGQAEVKRTRRTILVLDDEPIVVDFLRSALHAAGYEVITAADYDVARNLFDGHAGDLALIISEIALPRISGPEFINTLPTLQPRIPVMFMTCLGEKELTLKPLDYHAPVLQKPFRVADLKAAVEDIAIS